MRCTLYVMGGEVRCPTRGDIDVALCDACPDLVDVRRDRGRVSIVCSPPTRPLIALRGAF
jgi:hypothetical protein